MKIRVHYSDETVGEYSSIAEAESEILEMVTGSDFAATVDAVQEIDENDNVICNYGCNWSVKLIEV